MEFLLRADGNAQIGYGHIMRSLAFGAMAAEFIPVRLFCRNADQTARDAATSYGIAIEDLSNIPVSDEAAFIAAQAGTRNLVFIDGYGFGSAYLEMLHQAGCFVVCMDDHHDRFFPVHAVVNVADLEYPERVQRLPLTGLTFGLPYALLRREFLEPSIALNPSDDTVLVCFGGGGETLPLILNALDALENAPVACSKVRIVLHPSLLDRLPRNAYRFEVQSLSGLNAAQMRQAMQTCRFAILSASTVSLEARSLGIPVLAGYFTENQQGIYQSLVHRNEIEGCGDLRQVHPDAMLDAVVRVSKRKAAPGILEGGAIRQRYQRLIQSWITELDFRVRRATRDDGAQYLEWANHSDVRKNALNSAPILAENHFPWFERRLSSTESLLLVGEWKGIAVGQIRFDIHEEAWEIDYSVDAEQRSKGFGAMLIRHGMQQLWQQNPTLRTVLGWVKPENEASARVFRKLGFQDEGLHERQGFSLLRFRFSL